MKPDQEFELRRVLFACLTFFSWIFGVIVAIFFYNWKVDVFWFSATIFLPSVAILVQNVWSLWQIKNPNNFHVYNMWWNQNSRSAPRKRIAFSFVFFMGYLNLHHDIRGKRHEYDSLLVDLTTIHACVHWLPSLIYQIYISANVGYCHAFQLLYMMLLGFCLCIFLTSVIRRYTQYRFIYVFLWLAVKIFVNTYPVAVFASLKSERIYSRIYTIWGLLAIIPMAAHLLFYIKAHRLTWTSCLGTSKCCASCCGGAEKQRPLRLGSLFLVVSSIFGFVIVLAMMTKFMIKAGGGTVDVTATGSNSRLNDFEVCHDQLEALRTRNCSFLEEKILHPQGDCIGSPLLFSLCDSFPNAWIPAPDLEDGADPYVFGVIMIIVSFVTSEFFLAFVALVPLKGNDNWLKHIPSPTSAFRPSKVRTSTPDEESPEMPGGRDPDDAPEAANGAAASASAAAASASAAAAAALLSDEESRQLRPESVTHLDQVVARHDFISERMSFKKGDRLQVLDRDAVLWSVAVGGEQIQLHRGMFEEIPGFVFERCRALFDYDPEFDQEDDAGDELSLEYYDEVFVYEKPEGDWWFAQVGDRTGWVPKNFLEKIK